MSTEVNYNMLVPLLTWSSASSDPLLQSRLTFNASALSSLQQSNLTLVLAIGHPQCGKSTVLDSLLPASREVFRSLQVEDAAGVFISTESVKVGDNNVVLMEMTGIDFKHSEQAKKLLYVLLPVCSGVVACLEKTDLMKNLNQLLEVNQAVESDGRAMGRCQFLTMIEGASLLTGRPQYHRPRVRPGQREGLRLWKRGLFRSADRRRKGLHGSVCLGRETVQGGFYE